MVLPENKIIRSHALDVRQFTFNELHVSLYVPSEAQLRQEFLDAKAAGEDTECPYWGQVWSSAIALSQYIVDHPAFFRNRTVLELAGGLGLPSLVASHFAQSVCCSDYIAEVVEIASRSFSRNGRAIATAVIDWRQIQENLHPDIILLSDINYETDLFDRLFIVIQAQLSRGATIILSTPQRLMAKPFILRVLDFAVEQAELPVATSTGATEWISIYVLEKR